MKIYLSIITLLIFHCSYAQITITDNDLISVGDIIEAPILNSVSIHPQPLLVFLIQILIIVCMME